jgi:hypothetical protein
VEGPILIVQWDRTESWEIQRWHALRVRLVARILGVADLVHVRELSPALREMPPADLRARVRECMLELGEFDEEAGAHVLERARELRLNVEAGSVRP